MLIEFIAAIAAGFVGAGTALVLRKLSGGAVPRAAVPVFAGAGMIMTAIWSEYAWFSRTSETLPDGMVIVETHAQTSWYRPWTYVYPFTSRFMVVDQATIRRNDSFPEQRLADILVFTHRQPPASVPMLVDCQAVRHADIVDGASFANDGSVENADWRSMDRADPLFGAICS